MQMLFAPVFFILLVSAGGGTTFADDANGTTAKPDRDLAAARELNHHLDQTLPQTAAWLLKQQDPRKRAAGLLFHVDAIQKVETQAATAESLTSDERFREYDSIRQAALAGLKRAEARAQKLGEVKPADLLDQIEKAIRTTTDGAALAWLASACASAGIEEFCVDAGLDDAIVRHDGANLFSRLALVPDAPIGRRDQLIIESRNTKTYFGQLTAVWFEALDRGPGSAVLNRPYDKLVGAFSVSLAHATPTYQPVAQACQADITPDGELDRACDRITELMISDSHTALGQLVGLGLASHRAEARDDQAAATRLENRKVYENAVQHCRAKALTDDLENISEFEAREFMALLGKHGELEAYKRLAAQRDIDCSNPDDPAAEALEAYATGS